MRRFVGVALLCSTLALIAVAPAPKATPSAKPTASPTPHAAPLPAGPKVLVYVFDSPSDLDPKYGTAVAQVYDQVFTQVGGVTVLPTPQKIKREDYAKFAHSKGADYYISGYLQPIGDGVAIVSQIYDVNNEISVYSQTTQVTSMQDVGSQALSARQIILQAAGIDHPTIAAPQQSPTPSATAGASVSITNVLGNLFKGHAKSTPAPTEAPSAKPARGVLIAHLFGNAATGDLNSMTDELYRAMNAHYRTQMSNVNSMTAAKQADAACGVHRDNTIAGGKLDVSRSGGFRPHDTYTFTLDIYTCFGAKLYTVTKSDPDRVKAVHEAVDAYTTDHPDNN
ncbi:MAG: hypothetical protein KGN02_13015 [bacterium]|nr:hypothetical protein [bacterium]